MTRAKGLPLSLHDADSGESEGRAGEDAGRGAFPSGVKKNERSVGKDSED